VDLVLNEAYHVLNSIQVTPNKYFPGHRCVQLHCYTAAEISVEFKGGGGAGAGPYWLRFFFSKIYLCPYKRPVVRCVHLREMTTGLIHGLPPSPSKFLVSSLAAVRLH